MSSRGFGFWVACSAALMLWAPAVVAAPVSADQILDRTEPAPKQLRGVDIAEHLGDKLPLSLGFRDTQGRTVTLGQIFDGKTPVILTLNYSDCPMLCSLQLEGLVNGLRELKWTLNREFRVVTVSLQPNEPLETSRRALDRYLQQYGRPEARAGWDLLAGSERNVRAFAKAIGFSYRYMENKGQYAHPAAVVLAAPDGKLVRYLYGVKYEPKTLRLSLVEASEGRIGNTLDKFILYCFHYDSDEGKYAPVARQIMKVGGGVMVLALAGFLTVFIRWERQHGKNAKNAGSGKPEPEPEPDEGGDSDRSGVETP